MVILEQMLICSKLFTDIKCQDNRLNQGLLAGNRRMRLLQLCTSGELFEKPLQLFIDDLDVFVFQLWVVRL